MLAVGFDEPFSERPVVLTECGHAYAAMRWEAPNWFGGSFPFQVRSIVALLAEYVQEGWCCTPPCSISAR